MILLIWDFITLQFIMNHIPHKAVAILHPSIIDVISTDNQPLALDIQLTASILQTPQSMKQTYN